MTAVLYTLPGLSKPATVEVAEEAEAAGYSDGEKMVMGCGGKYDPPKMFWKLYISKPTLMLPHPEG